jgi:hypothetical protein
MDDSKVKINRSIRTRYFLLSLLYLFVHALDIEKDFKSQLSVFVPEIFRSDNENFVKEINGEQITARQLFEYFRVHIRMHHIQLMSHHCLRSC